MTKEERSRLCAAIALSLCVHIAVFAAISLTPQRVSEKDPVMSVRLVTLSGPRGTGGGGGCDRLPVQPGRGYGDRAQFADRRRIYD